MYLYLTICSSVLSMVGNRTPTSNWKFIMLVAPEPLTQVAARIYLFAVKSNANRKKIKGNKNFKIWKKKENWKYKKLQQVIDYTQQTQLQKIRRLVIRLKNTAKT